MACSWLAVARDGDIIWTPAPWPASFLDQFALSGAPVVRTVENWSDVEESVEFVPWGWTEELIAMARVKSWSAALPDPAIVRWANSRRTSAAFEHQWSVGLPGAATCTSFTAAEAAIQALPARSPWVIKADFSMSARERITGVGPLRPEAVGWLERRLAADGVVFFEPWVERVEEVGVLFEVPRECDSGPVLLGVVPMVISAGGHYRGSWFAWPGQEPAWWSEAIATATQAATALQHAGYLGPLGIDAMQYRTPDGTLAVRPLQDINARWTMGRVALGWRHRFPDAACGYWWQGPPSAFAHGEHLIPLGKNVIDPTAINVMPTSPIEWGDQPMSHVSGLVMI